jgi:hypothetical protein
VFGSISNLSRPALDILGYGPRLRDREIRLLILSRHSVPNAPIHGLLETFSIDDCPRYKAVSHRYCRGDRDAIYIGSYWDVLPIYKDDMPMLQHLRARGPILSMLWVDQICVNQRVDEEKVFAFQRMAEYYSHADSVVVWLGAELASGENRQNQKDGFSADALLAPMTGSKVTFDWDLFRNELDIWYLSRNGAGVRNSSMMMHANRFVVPAFEKEIRVEIGATNRQGKRAVSHVALISSINPAEDIVYIPKGTGTPSKRLRHLASSIEEAGYDFGLGYDSDAEEQAIPTKRKNFSTGKGIQLRSSVSPPGQRINRAQATTDSDRNLTVKARPAMSDETKVGISSASQENHWNAASSGDPLLSPTTTKPWIEEALRLAGLNDAHGIQTIYTGSPYRLEDLRFHLESLISELRHSRPSSITLEETITFTWVDQFKLAVEGTSKQRWNWWPLSPPRREPDGKYETVCVSWICVGRPFRVSESLSVMKADDSIIRAVGSHVVSTYLLSSDTVFVIM